MKTLDQLIAARRSVRRFDGSKAVSEEHLRQMIAAAIEAPTWKNSQTGRYYVATSAEMLRQVKESLPEFNQKSTEGASALIVTTFKHNRSGFERTGEPTNELGNGWGCYDLGLQASLMLLKAAELGIDTLVLGIRDADRLKEALSIPDDETVVAIVAVGYRQEEPVRPKRKAVDEVARFV